MEEKKHTFVICAYKESEYLEECIKSLLLQKEHSEVILVTSTPNDFIGNLCEKYAIENYINKGESGITQDWEFALSKVKTKYATIAHQDDIYFESYSKRMIEACEKASQSIICFSDYTEVRNGKYVSNNRNLKIKRLLLKPLLFKSLQKSVFVRRRVLSLGNPICCPSVTYNMDNTPRPFFLNHFKSNEDWEAWERYSTRQGEYVYVPDKLMAHRVHEDSETSSIINEGTRTQEDYEMFKKFWPNSIARWLTKKYKESEKSNKI